MANEKERRKSRNARAACRCGLERRVSILFLNSSGSARLRVGAEFVSVLQIGDQDPKRRREGTRKQGSLEDSRKSGGPILFQRSQNSPLLRATLLWIRLVFRSPAKGVTPCTVQFCLTLRETVPSTSCQNSLSSLVRSTPNRRHSGSNPREAALK